MQSEKYECTFVKRMIMTALELYEQEHEEIQNKLSNVQLPRGQETMFCWMVGTSLNVTGQTVKNYMAGNVKDGFLAKAIYNEFKRLKLTK